VVDIAQNLFSTRRGAILVGAAAAVLAALILFVYLHAYRNSLNSAKTPTAVLVAKNLIQKGTPGNIIGSSSQFQVASIPRGQLQAGALTDPALLNGRVAATDIYPGQQLTATDFVYAAPGALPIAITGNQRVINITSDAQHGLIGQVNAGDHVDVFAGLNLRTPSGSIPVIKLLMANVPVLKVPLGSGGQLTLKVNEREAGELAYASDNGRLWFVLRPASGAKTVDAGVISAQTLLTAKPVR